MPGATAAAAMTLRRQFCFPLSLGTDICNIPRIRRILDGPQRDRFIRRVLLPEERGRVYNYLNTTPGQVSRTAVASDVELGRRKAAEFLAGRFAAKEAVIKAHPHLRISFEDITIAPRQPDPKEAGNAAVNAGGGGSGGGPPVALIRHIEDGREVVQEALVSISHDADYSTAVCMGMTDGDGRN
ncbi:hypothetical protein MCOR27_001456 [Pyricularia oryzae]|uniref:4'-phosphopantetheinyl transferase domain-containing protein n=1 Tax=Pyricularia grisea TaxID=148305 RepID=A0ABQ8NM97_PYRGI|nr:hypothetical protein MCOR01_010363 [Pyricularia oryzae]KAI6299283.1 hypothetical protein MCOR33_004809 [Pyricularia grisea]KAH9438670.1 hypothetical protein MCOR02_002280 [Pyricularia oryzae]KAI6261605.1 hypothetical protein MCOR19_002173 [Pyricularia oryzae]KAI6287282.1 hypothetical protein MCOR27_001456 [Pyricularia oryzae]